MGSFPDDFVFEWDTQFSYAEIGNFPDNFIFLNDWQQFFRWARQVSRLYVLNKIHNFYQVDILHFPGTL